MKRLHVIGGRWFTASLGGLLFTTVFALSPSPAEAQCQQWDVSGTWLAYQSNKGRVQFDLQQSGTQFTGTARDLAGNDNRPVKGTIRGNKFKVSVTWRAGSSEAVYTGTVDSSGVIHGKTSEYFSGAKATWYSDKAMKCGR